MKEVKISMELALMILAQLQDIGSYTSMRLVESLESELEIAQEKTKKQEQMVELQYYFTEKDGKVWKVQSIDGGEWEWIETPYNQIPYIFTKRVSKEELKSPSSSK